MISYKGQVNWFQTKQNYVTYLVVLLYKELTRQLCLLFHLSKEVW